MALKKTITINYLNKELIFKDSYIKIDNVSGNKEMLNVIVKIFDFENGNVIKTFEFNFVPKAKDTALRWDKQAYEYLKTLDDFEDAIDV